MPDSSDPSLESRIADLERIVHDLAAERDIRELMSRYSFTADLGWGDEFAQLWTPDGAYDLGEANVGTYQGRFEGTAALRELVAGEGMPPRGMSQHHTLGPMVVEVNGDEAFAQGYSVTFVRRDDGIESWCMGFNHWAFQRKGGRWLIHRRHRRETGPGAAEPMIGAAARGARLTDVELG